ncbi:hypothetical protein [Enterococcus sp. AZ163]|uniref:hypothetical protein n=1 Tax=Enterococcus sp. AZ163 TaxID=2774638 RepID=UPI003D2B5DCD
MAKITKPLGTRQLHNMLRNSLEKRIRDFYQITNDGAYVIQCALIVLLRNALCPADFSYLAADLIRSLFMESKDLQEVRELCVYFRPYFSDKEWDIILRRLFSNSKKRKELTEQALLYMEKFPLLHSGEREVEAKASLISTFEDENGKKHNWTLSNVDPTLSTQEHEDYLSLLSTVDILQKDGVRRFVTVVEVKYRLFRTSITRKTIEETTARKQQCETLPRVKKTSHTTESEQMKSVKPLVPSGEVLSRYGKPCKNGDQVMETYLPKDFDYSSMTKKELREFVKSTLPKGSKLKDFNFEFVDSIEETVSESENGAGPPSTNKDWRTNQNLVRKVNKKRRKKKRR